MNGILDNDVPFPVWCDDVQPENVPVDKAIISLECWIGSYIYRSGRISHASPWWLLLKKPEDWPQGLNTSVLSIRKRSRPFLYSNTEIRRRGNQEEVASR